MNIKGIQIATVVFLIISAVLIWQAISLYSEISILQEQTKNQESGIKNSEDVLKRLKEFIGFTSENKEVLSKFDSILPSEEDNASLLSSLDSMARANGLIASSITFADTKKIESGEQISADGAIQNNYNDTESKNIKLSLSGRYDSFKNFLITIERSLRMLDIVSIDFSGGTVSQETNASEKVYSFSIELKTYLYEPSNEKNIAVLLGSGKFSNFTAKNLSFIKEKAFNSLLLPPEYNVNAGTDEIGNQTIF